MSFFPIAATPQAAYRLRALLEHARDRSRFYGPRLAGLPVDLAQAWPRIPIVEKPELMLRFDDWVTDRRITFSAVEQWVSDASRIGQDFLGRYAVWSTSGTSGVPGLFVHDGHALAIYETLLHSRSDRRARAGGAWAWGAPPRSALVIAMDAHYAGISFWARQRRLFPALASSSRAFNVTWPGERLCAELQAWQPSFLSSYPSMLAELARWQQEGRIHLNLSTLWSGGERLCPSTQAWISSVFQAPVINDYGASECLTMAFECEQGHLHLNDDWVLLEPVDRHDQPVPPGVASHSVLLTNLANQVQPLIRYRLGDSVTFLPEPCPCGNRRPALTVEGRGDDTLCFQDARRHAVHLSPMALTTVLEEGAGVHRFQLRQTAADAIELRLDVLGLAAPDSVRGQALQVLRRFLAEQGLGQVQVRLDDALPVEDAHSGKLRQVVCLVH
jgi:phenylacetate-CoA ligase